MGPPENFVVFLRDQFDLKTFVEGGTFSGETAAWASSRFEAVYTIENARAYHEASLARYSAKKNIRFLLGDTRELLGQVVRELSGPAIFWLDSHWCGAGSYGEHDPCPLLDEIAIIDGSARDHFLLIDDARLFLAPPPRPNVWEQWPSIDAVIGALHRQRHDRYIAVIDDVIIAVPGSFRIPVAAWLQDFTSHQWGQRQHPETMPAGVRTDTGRARFTRWMVRRLVGTRS